MSKNILIIDDEKKFCALMSEFLTGEGFSIETAHDGLEGIIKTESFKPDVILLDFKMPRLGGIEALKKIKEKTSAPIIIVTGSVENDIEDTCLSIGAFGYIQKPVMLDNILEQINLALKES